MIQLTKKIKHKIKFIYEYFFNKFIEVYKNIYYLKKFFDSKIRKLYLSFLKGKDQIDYEEYFLQDKGSNYDNVWVKGGIPESIVTSLILSKRIKDLQKYFKNLKRKKLLDTGCSSGVFLRLCEKFEIQTFGVEISKLAIEEAKLQTSAKLFQLDISNEKLPFRSNTFDIITCFDVIEHVKNINFYIKEAKRVLKKNGIFYIITPNGKQPADNDISHFNLKKHSEWRKIFIKNNFFIENTYLYTWYSPVPYLFIQKIRKKLNELKKFGIEQSVFILRKK